MLNQNLIPAFFIIFLVSFALSFAIVVLGRVFPHALQAHDRRFSRQRVHTKPTSRFGGLAIFLSFLISLGFVAPRLFSAYREFLVATSILFCVAFLEDVLGRVPALVRLAAAIMASAVFILSLDVWLPRIGIEFVDPLFRHLAIGLPFTCLLVAGISNGFNMIDGVNGLSGFTGLFSCFSLYILSYFSGYQEMQFLTLSLAAAIAGFLILNFPKARIFMGDAGAYVIGFVLPWFGISILLRAPDVSPWAVLLALFWPFAEVALTFTRRIIGGRPTMHPDRLHVHQVVMRVIQIRILRRRDKNYANPLTTFVIMPFILIPHFFAIVFWNQNQMALPAFLFVFVSFIIGFYQVLKFGMRRYR